MSICGDTININVAAKARLRIEIALRSNTTAKRTIKIIIYARCVGMAAPDIIRYIVLMAIAQKAAIFFELYRNERLGNNAMRKRTKKNIKPAIMLMWRPEIERKCAKPEFL